MEKKSEFRSNPLYVQSVSLQQRYKEYTQENRRDWVKLNIYIQKNEIQTYFTLYTKTTENQLNRQI